MAEQNFYGTSGIYPASLGQKSNEQSGKAIMARQREGDVSTSNYADMFKRALIYAGKIFEDLRKKIYDGSREFQVMSEDNKTRGVKINQKYQDPKTGKMIEYDMTKGKMGVAVTTGVSYTTKREESREAQIQLFQANPQAMLPALPMIVRSMDWPNADKTADAIERGLPPELRDPDRQAEQMQGIPPAAQAQLQQAQQIIQQLGQALQEAQQAADDKQAEAQMKMGELQIKAQSAQTQAEKNRIDAELKAAELQFEKEKFAVDSALESRRLELEKVKFITELQRQSEEKSMDDFDEDEFMSKLGENALQGYQMDKQAKMEQKRIEDEIKAEKEMSDMQEAEMMKQNMAATVEMLMQMKNSFQQLSEDIRAPKVIDVLRNPKTGLIEQAFTRTT